MKVELEITEICSIIALCESCGKMLSDKEKFEKIAVKLRKQMGLE